MNVLNLINEIKEKKRQIKTNLLYHIYAMSNSQISTTHTKYGHIIRVCEFGTESKRQTGLNQYNLKGTILIYSYVMKLCFILIRKNMTNMS